VLFNSVTFFGFFAIVFALYLLAFSLPRPKRVQNALLLVASYVFYGAWDWRFLGLLVLSTLIDYVSARKIEDSPTEQRRRWLLLSVISNLGILGFFKYFNFFVDSFVALAGAIGLSVSVPMLAIVLPVGISFYTFQTMSYTIDVYQGRLKATRNLGSFALFVVYFPQLVAGPIERATRLLPQLEAERQITYEKLRDGAWLILIGLFKKVVVADNMARIVDPVFGADGASGAATWLAVYAFALQIYADFSGYTDIARGVSKMLGIELMLNFRRPYFAGNPQQFWQRWHISLSQWLRDYLYIPLGGNRGGPAKTNRNLMLTMLLGGLWHGASWMFVIWGAIHGALLVVHRLWQQRIGQSALAGLVFAPRSRPAPGALPARLRRLAAPLLGVLFFHAVCFAWIFFRARSMGEVGNVLTGLGSGLAFGPKELATLRLMLVCAGPLLVLDLWEELWERLHGKTMPADGFGTSPTFLFMAPAALRGLIFAILLFALAVIGAPSGVEFIYFQF
jgi:alginate O-acetyltransferase complex protein AlgI